MEKWLGIAIACLFAGVGVAGSFDYYAKGQCRVAAIQKGLSAEDIAKICK